MGFSVDANTKGFPMLLQPLMIQKLSGEPEQAVKLTLIWTGLLF